MSEPSARLRASPKRFHWILAAQFGLVLGTATALLGFASVRLRAEDARAGLRQLAIRRLDERLREASATSTRWLGDRDDAQRGAAARSFGALTASSEPLRDALPEGASIVAGLESSIAEGSGLVQGPPTDARGDRLRAVQASLARATEALRELDTLSGDLGRRSLDRTLRGLLGIGGAAVLGFVVTALLARRSFLAEGRLRADDIETALRAVSRRLTDDAAAETPVAAGEHGPAVTELVSAVEANALRLRGLERALDMERARASFTYHLTRTLDLADEEEEVESTLARATASAFPTRRFRLLLADNSQSALEPRTGDAEQICTPPSPNGCPAVRWGRIVVSTKGDGMDACPRLRNRDSVVTCCSIAVRGRAVGALQLIGDALDERQVQLLGTLTLAVGARLGIVRSLDERELQAHTDVLTGLANRRAMNEALAKLDARDESYAVIAADLDHFKRLNDTHGHDTGDHCLKVFGQVLRDACRAEDLPCRPGGEEFVIVLPRADAAAGVVVAERIRTTLAHASRRAGLAFTVSLGVAARPSHGRVASDVLKAADAALYKAKEAGRDRVVAVRMSEPPAPVREVTAGLDPLRALAAETSAA
jgi:diguanylate cyclase (GGDEF)-like protein